MTLALPSCLISQTRPLMCNVCLLFFSAIRPAKIVPGVSRQAINPGTRFSTRSPNPQAGWGALAADDLGPALRRNGSDAELGKMDEIDQSEQCNQYARVRASWGFRVDRFDR